ncbi:hypothetical protein GCM10009854_47580 [Saccharopolyspora halophila]|uniref:TIGR02679 family protein n=1 Tax=Saccharopolyspora halophila TaxID=405551 RepID=A0ABN3GXF2_9PSEU
MSLPAALRATELRRLWEAAHERLSSGRAVARIRVGPMAEAERAAVADLLGMERTPGEYCTVSLSKLDAVLAEAGTDVSAVVTEIVGPVGDRAGERSRAASERAALWEWLSDHPEVQRQPALQSWAEQVRRAGVLDGSVTRTREVLADALAVLARLPAEGQPLATIADEVTGDPHALDDGTRLGAVVLRAMSSVFNVDLPGSAEERRLLWQRAGVADDELSSVVLAAGVRLSGAGVVASLTTACADAGQAVALTLAQLRASELGAVPTEVWVVENPSIVAMATHRFGLRCPPLVCTSGWPNTAVMLLLRRLAEGGARLHYHGDFDGEGLRIAAYVMEKVGATPWRMSTRDYLDACHSNSPEPGRVTQVPWDALLADTVRSEQRTVSEEQVAGVLLNDLAESAPGSLSGGFEQGKFDEAG